MCSDWRGFKVHLWISKSGCITHKEKLNHSHLKHSHNLKWMVHHTLQDIIKDYCARGRETCHVISLTRSNGEVDVVKYCSFKYRQILIWIYFFLRGTRTTKYEDKPTVLTFSLHEKLSKHWFFSPVSSIMLNVVVKICTIPFRSRSSCVVLVTFSV